MRHLAVLTLVAVVAGLAIAQQDGGLKGAKRPGPVKTDQFNDRPKAELQRGGEITEAVDVGFRSLDAYQDTSATTSEIVQQYIEEALKTSNVETWGDMPLLAESWDVEDNAALHIGYVIVRKDGSKVAGQLAEKDGKVVVTTDKSVVHAFKREDVDVRNDLVRGRITAVAEGYEVRDLKGSAVRKLRKEEVAEVRYGTSFTFRLRKGVKFHNGDDFTAKDVEFTYKLIHDPRNEMPSIQGYFDNVIECAVLDDFTVRMTYREQYWMALNVCGGYLYVRPHKAWDPGGDIDKNPDDFFKKLKNHPLTLNPIGTGPYMLDSYKKDFEVVLKRFDGWWGAKVLPAPLNAQYPDKLRFRIIKDKVAQLAALKNGEVDYVTSIPPEQFDNVVGDDAKPNVEMRKQFAAVTIVYPSYGYVGFNLRKPLWKDKRLRWALAYGSNDQDAFIKSVLKGRAERVAGDYYMFCDSYNPETKPVPYDPKKAEELLGEAGWFDSDGDGILDNGGQKLEFVLLTRQMEPTMPAFKYLLQMQDNLKKLGIKMEISMLEWGAFLEKIEKGDFDVCRLGWAMASPPNQQDNFQLWHSSQIGEGGSNHCAYANPELDKLLVDIKKELDEKKRNQIEWKVQRILYDDQPYNWMYMPAEHRLYNKKWRAVRFWVPRPCHSLNEWCQAPGEK